MTFSIVGHCTKTGQFGMAISSSSPAVAGRCAYARAGVGAVASQNITDPRLGVAVLDAMGHGMGAEAAVDSVIQAAEHSAYRQILAVDKNGQCAIFSGQNTLGIHAEYISDHAAAAGNLLANTDIPGAMVEAFHGVEDDLGGRLIAALNAGLDAGGEAGSVHSAGLLLVEREDWPLAELRCDWSQSCPIANITEAWRVYKPQMQDYVTRALNPSAAPSYGVPGDL